MKRLLLALCCAVLGMLRAAEPVAAEPTAGELNRLAGTPLFGETELWRERSSEVIRRLNINCRADGMGREQMFSTKFSRTIFGCRAEEIRLFAVNGVLTRIDLFFLNKGDSVDKKRSNFATFRRKLRAAHRDLEKLLDESFGGSQKAVLATAATKHQLPAWTTGRYVLLIDYVPDEYLIMHIVPPEALGKKRDSGDAPAVSRRSYAERVKRTDFGDVYIADVPMVDQGPKGYCVPATVERLARYFGVSGVDMHKLAEQANTRGGGGTTAKGMLRGVHKLLGGSGLQVRSAGRLSKGTIADFVDRGLPLMWFHYSTPEFRKRIDQSIASRGRATPEGWRKQLRRQRLVKKGTQGAHVALIVGYNKKSGEVAISNSWGDRHRISWVRFADMEQLNQSCDLYVGSPRK